PPPSARAPRLAGEAARAADAAGAADPVQVTEGLHGVLRAVVRAAHRARGPAEGRNETRREHAAGAGGGKAALTTGFTRRLTVDEVARSVHVSPYHLT